MSRAAPRPGGRLVLAGLLAVVALAPLPFGSNLPVFWSLLGVAVGLLLAAWTVAAAAAGAEVPVHWRRHWPASLAFAAVLAWLLLQAAPWAPEAWQHPLWRTGAAALGEAGGGSISLAPGEGLAATMRLAAYGGVFWLAMQLGRDRVNADRLLRTVAIAGAAYGAYGLVVEFADAGRILWFEKTAYRDSLTATFVNRNSFATYAGLALLAALALAKRRMRRLEHDAAGIPETLARRIGGFGLLPLLAVLTLGAALLLTHSRGGLIATLAGLAVLLLGEALGHGRPSSARRFALLTLAGSLLLLVAGGGITLQRLEQDGIQALHVRGWIYERTMDGIGERPLAGTGHGSFASVFDGWRDSRMIDLDRVDKAHNTYLEFAAEAGLPATLLLLAAIAWIAWNCLRGALQRRRDATYPEVALAATALVAVHALFDFSLQIPAVAVTYCTLLGLGFAQSWSSREP